jgi:extracellular elastinolytic metalloproteinase
MKRPQKPFQFSRTVLVGALLAALSGGAMAASFDERSANVERASPGRSLAPAGLLSHRDAVVARLRERGASEATLRSLVEVSRGTAKTGMTHARYEQQVGGVSVYGSMVKATFGRGGELVHLIDKIAPVAMPGARAASISERAALDVAMARVHPGVQPTFAQGLRSGESLRFGGGAFFHQDPAVTRVLIAQDGGGLAQAFLVETWSERQNLLHHTLIGGDGAVLKVERRTSSDSYNVFTNDPSKGAQTIMNGPGAGNQESPSGWLAGMQKTAKIMGNNVTAYLDTDNDDRPDAGGTRVRSGNFLTPVDLGTTPSGTSNREVAVQNLFYLNNRIHDILYRHGFEEVAGNFQADNFSKGGVGGDPVRAEAQDGGGLNNANFATPPDGRKPRMQMYLWSGAGPTHDVVVAGGPSYGAMGAGFGPVIDTTGLTGAVVLGDDGVAAPGGGAVNDGCEPLSAPQVSGKLVLLDRGFCAFTQKVQNAQDAGATGVIIANNAPSAIFEMGGTSATITISSVMISQADGADLRVRTAATVTMQARAVQPLRIDATLDSDIVYHEYGHGLTWRMIGSMDSPLSGAVGEGASDVLAFMVNGDDAIAEYSFSNPNGIRRNRYAGYPRTYADVTGGEVHNDGEIYAAVMWRLRELWIASGRSDDTIFGHFVDGMQYTIPSPSFEHMRNGMLDTIAFNVAGDAVARCALVWQAFAQFGIGDGASGTVSRSGVVTITPSTVARSDCSH